VSESTNNAKSEVRFKQLIRNPWCVHNRLFNAYFKDKLLIISIVFMAQLKLQEETIPLPPTFASLSVLAAEPATFFVGCSTVSGM
jgi:hypothetical protein